MQESILLAASTEKGAALLQSLLSPGAAEQIRICRSGGEVRRALAEQEFSTVMINTPLPDESGLDLAMETAHQTISAVILLVKADLADAVSVRMEEYGVLVVAKPVVRALFDQSLRCGTAARKRMAALREENRRLEKKLAEQRMVDRAKCLLIQHEGMTEEQAHRHIEKTAMDTRSTRMAIARQIVTDYEE